MRRSDILHKLKSRSLENLLRGDSGISSERNITHEKKWKEAAVLVPLIDRRDGLTILLTRRTDHLHDHAGQISFPGGRKDRGDRNATATALREAQEEIGLQPHHVEIVAELDPYITRTGFVVTPVVAIIDSKAEFSADPFEVAEIFEVPLSFLLEPDSCQQVRRLIADQMRFFYAFTWQQYYIWGATAGMLVNLIEHLVGPRERP